MDVQSYGDYPLLDFENAASRNNNYDWDEQYFRRNHGDPLHHAHMFTMASYPAQDRQNIGMQWDYYRGIRFYFGWILFVFTIGMLDLFVSKEWGWTALMPNRNNDGFQHEFQQWNSGLYRTSGMHNDNLGHKGEYRFRGGIQNREDDRVERWGVRRQDNYCIPGWEDLDKVPEYLHEF